MKEVNYVLPSTLFRLWITIMSNNKKTLQDENSLPPDESVREERLQSLKEAVEAGTYRIDTRILADSLLSHLLQKHWERLKKQ